MFAILLCVMWYLFSFNGESADIDVYERFYGYSDRIDEAMFEPGFFLMCKLCSGFGLSFEQFHQLFGLIAFSLIGISVAQYCVYPTLPMILYLLYPFLLDCAQIRHFMAVAIFVFAIRYLRSYSLKNLLFYVSLILIAASFQLTAIAFFAFLLVYVKKRRRVYFIAVFITLLLFTLGMSIKSLPVFSYILDLRDKDFYEDSMPMMQLLMYSLFYLILISLAVLAYKRGRFKNEGKECMQEMMVKISYVAMTFIPVLLVDFQFTRLFRASLLPVYIAIANNIACSTNLKKFFLIGFVLVLMVLMSYKLFWVGSYFDSLTAPILGLTPKQ